MGYQARRRPSCVCRIPPADVILPKVVELRPVAGEPRLTRFSALVISARNSRFISSFSLNLRKRPMSTHFAPGPSIRLREELPSAPVAGAAKAAVLNDALVTSERERLASSLGLPMMSTRSVLLPSTLVSVPVVKVSGVPLRAVQIGRASCRERVEIAAG